MRVLKITCLAFLALIFSGQLLVAQSDNSEAPKTKKKMVIVKKSIDDDGNEVVEKIVKEGDDVDVMEWSDEGDLQKINVDVNVEGEDGARVFKIKKSVNGEEQDFEWEDNGEIPEEIRRQLEEAGVEIETLPHERKEVRVFKTNENKAFLGVVMGKKMKVENKDGVETTFTEGESKDGVVINEVVEGSAAEAAGLQKGDILSAIDGKPVNSIDGVVEILSAKEPDDQVAIKYLRNGQAQTTSATLKAPEAGAQKMIWLNNEGEEINLSEGKKKIIIHKEPGEETAGETVKHKKKIVVIYKDKDEKITEADSGEEVVMPEAKIERKMEQNQVMFESLDIFPNPTQGVLQVNFKAAAVPTLVIISDVTGKEIYREELNGFSGDYNRQIDLKHAAKGTLLLSIKQGDKVYAEKIILN